MKPQTKLAIAVFAIVVVSVVVGLATRQYLRSLLL